VRKRVKLQSSSVKWDCKPIAWYPQHFKKFLDFICSGSALILLSPVLTILAMVVRKEIGRPVFFVQARPGLHGQPFHIYKFRTMTDQRDANGNLLPDAVRLTRLGRFLRSTSMDELPELWNVLKGDMSIVGPRPLLMKYLPRYTKEQARRHDVRPGLTGWAQINGRNAITWEEKFTLDTWYVDNLSFGLDIKIIFTTLMKVIRREGISANGEATMSEFLGTAKSLSA